MSESRDWKTTEWRIVYDESFTSAKNLRKMKRDAHFKRKVDIKASEKPTDE